ncbi:MAG: hypothetical protein AAB074_07135 [Planctomycetota bacterium]
MRPFLASLALVALQSPLLAETAERDRFDGAGRIVILDESHKLHVVAPSGKLLASPASIAIRQGNSAARFISGRFIVSGYDAEARAFVRIHDALDLAFPEIAAFKGHARASLNDAGTRIALTGDGKDNTTIEIADVAKPETRVKVWPAQGERALLGESAWCGPDRFAFTAHLVGSKKGSSDLYVWEQGAVKKVTDGLYVSQISVSPDGARLLAVRSESLATLECTVDLLTFSSGEWKTVAKAGQTRPEQVAWSADGKRFALAEETGLRICPVSGEAGEVIAAGRCGGATWSPDGRRLAYTKLSKGYMLEGVIRDLEGIKTANLGTTVCADGGCVLAFASLLWSPDGTAVAFERGVKSNGDDPRVRESHRETWVCAPDGSGAFRLREGATVLLGWLPAK